MTIQDVDDKKQFFECACHSDEHTVSFLYLKTDDPVDREVYLSVFLETDGFFRRLWTALKYVFGYKCRYGHFGCWILRKEDLERLIKLLEVYREDMERQRLESEIKKDGIPSADGVPDLP